MSIVKYQIFVSSTYDDLRDERDQVIKACLEIGHIPVGMEMFSAANEEQWKIITRQIDDSDYFVVIVANRYGSMLNGVSFTEMEYDYAVSKGIPVLGFVLDSKAAWPTERSESNRRAIPKLDAFKKKVKGKPVSFWKNKEELHGNCAIALAKAIASQPRRGWIRSPIDLPPQITQNYEINTVYNGVENAPEHLMSENERLRFLVFQLRDEPLLLTFPTNKASVTRIVFVEGYVKDRNASIWPIVRTIAGSTYWVQSRAEISGDGRWKAKVVIGQNGTADVGAHYELGVFVNPGLPVREGDELDSWPDAEFKSEFVEIIRT
jgi:hypothetical protein